MFYICDKCGKAYEFKMALNKRTVVIATCNQPGCNYKACERCTNIGQVTKSPCPRCGQSMWSTALLKEVKTEPTIREKIRDFFFGLLDKIINLKYR